MKALIRNPDETVTEADGIEGIDWKTGMPLTGEKWFGGPYKLVENYAASVDEEDTVQPGQPEIEEEIVENDDVVIIDGKRYSKTELRSLLE